MVFVIDDRADYRFLVQQVFSRFLPSCPVRFFTGGDALSAFIQAGPMPDNGLPGLILLDLNMPRLNGYQTLTVLRQVPGWRHIPVVMMSDLGTEQEQKQCYEAGANSFIAKPAGLDEMKQLIPTLAHYWLELNQLPHRK